MARTIRPNDRQQDAAQLNPHAGARRRLLKAAGMTAMAGFVALDWRRPLVRLGSLPAHAQATANLCDIVLTGSAAQVGSSTGISTAFWTYLAGVSEVGGTSESGPSSTNQTTAFDIPGWTFQPSAPGSYVALQTLIISAGGGEFNWIARADCCDASAQGVTLFASAPNGASTITTPNPGQYFLVGDDGSCTWNPD